MNKVKITDNSSKFVIGNETVLDRVFANTAIDIIRLSKMQVPHLTGALQSSGKIVRKGIMSYEVFYNTPYALRWEYETPPGGFKKGRKSRYLRDPAKHFTSPSVLIPQIKAAGVKI